MADQDIEQLEGRCEQLAYELYMMIATMNNEPGGPGLVPAMADLREAIASLSGVLTVLEERASQLEGGDRDVGR
jgi:hypothetical protein